MYKTWHVKSITFHIACGENFKKLFNQDGAQQSLFCKISFQKVISSLTLVVTSNEEMFEAAAALLLLFFGIECLEGIEEPSIVLFLFLKKEPKSR